MANQSKKSRSKSTTVHHKSRNPYTNFLRDFSRSCRTHRHDETRKELFKFAAQRWKQMSAEDKARYITAAKNVNKPKPLKKTKVQKKKNKRKRVTCCSKCGHRMGSPISSPHHSIMSIWTIKGKDSRRSGTTSKTSSHSRTSSAPETTVSDYTEDSSS